MVLKTEWSREFVLTDSVEIKKDGTRRTRLFYCDLMANWQKDYSKMFIDSSERFVPSKLIYTLSGIQSHPNSIPITKRSWTTKHRSASSASSIVRWLIDSLAMDWLRSHTIKSLSSLTYLDPVNLKLRSFYTWNRKFIISSFFDTHCTHCHESK